MAEAGYENQYKMKNGIFKEIMNVLDKKPLYDDVNKQGSDTA
ncbi:hypothetical protein [Borreliella valaisiana]